MTAQVDGENEKRYFITAEGCRVLRRENEREAMELGIAVEELERRHKAWLSASPQDKKMHPDWSSPAALGLYPHFK